MLRGLLVALIVLAPSSAVLPADVRAGTAHWTPGPNVRWQVQFAGRIDRTVDVDVFDLDAFDTPARLVRALHTNGKRVVCYINAGAWEEWRPDAARYPEATKGRALERWPGERWLDIRRLDVLAPILIDRVELCRQKGFDGIEFDNVDGYTNATGFELSSADQLSFNRWLANAAHERGLAVGLKNALELVEDLEPDFDFAIVEQCFVYRECELTGPFVNAGKSVLDIEYSLSRRAFCGRAERLGMQAMRKHVELDAWRRAC